MKIDRKKAFNIEVEQLKRSEQFVCIRPLGKDGCKFKHKDLMACVWLRKCEYAN